MKRTSKNRTALPKTVDGVHVTHDTNIAEIAEVATLTRFQSKHLLVNDALTISKGQNLDFILPRIDGRT